MNARISGGSVIAARTALLVSAPVTHSGTKPMALIDSSACSLSSLTRATAARNAATATGGAPGGSTTWRCIAPLVVWIGREGPQHWPGGVERSLLTNEPWHGQLRAAI